jgi:Rod binding domain-containing protein
MQVTNPSVSVAHEASGHATASPQLVKAANAFEANFLGELLKPMREDPLFGDGSGLGGDSLGSDGPGGAMGTIGNLASEAFAQAIVKQGGLGIAKQVLAQLGPMEAARSQQTNLLTGPECGACAMPLAMGPEAARALNAGSMEMLGQGNLPALQLNQSGKDGAEKPARSAAMRESRNHLQPTGAVRAIERTK